MTRFFLTSQIKLAMYIVIVSFDWIARFSILFFFSLSFFLSIFVCFLTKWIQKKNKCPLITMLISWSLSFWFFFFTRRGCFKVRRIEVHLRLFCLRTCRGHSSPWRETCVCRGLRAPPSPISRLAERTLSLTLIYLWNPSYLS